MWVVWVRNAVFWGSLGMSVGTCGVLYMSAEVWRSWEVGWIFRVLGFLVSGSMGSGELWGDVGGLGHHIFQSIY